MNLIAIFRLAALECLVDYVSLEGQNSDLMYLLDMVENDKESRVVALNIVYRSLAQLLHVHCTKCIKQFCKPNFYFREVLSWGGGTLDFLKTV